MIVTGVHEFLIGGLGVVVSDPCGPLSAFAMNSSVVKHLTEGYFYLDATFQGRRTGIKTYIGCCDIEKRHSRQIEGNITAKR